MIMRVLSISYICIDSQYNYTQIKRMKTLIQKIIVNYFGTFINGIQKDKLSVDLLGGNFKLQNISLNHQYFNGLNTPFKLTHSSIGKLNLQAPLSKLSSTPVQCILDNIYAVFQFRDHQQKQELSADKQFQARKQELEKYIRQMFENYLKKLREKEEKKEEGMMSKMGKKIIDNLQLKIVNVHIRFEQKGLTSQYGWGMTLQEINFITTDRQWKPAFIDRSTEANKNEKLFKKMNLQNFCIYWQSSTMSSENIFIREIESPVQRNAKMGEMIHENNYAIIGLTSEFKLIMNPKEDIKAPLYQLSVQLAPIKFDLERVQVSEMIDFAKKNFIQNQQILKSITLKKKKSNTQTQFKDRQKYQNIFYEYVENYIISQQSGAKQNRDQFEDEFEANIALKNLFSKVQYQQLIILALKPIKKQVKMARQRELKKKKKGWFGGEYQLTEQELKALEDFVEDTEQVQDKERPTSSPFFSLSLLINGGIFSFFDHKGKEQQEKIVFNIGVIESLIEKSQDESSLNLQLNIQSIGLDLFLPAYKSSQKTRMNIFSNDIGLIQKSKKNEKFVSIKYTKKVDTGQQPIIQTDIQGEIKRVIITYKKLYMKKFQSFFTFKNLNDDIKKETKKKWGIHHRRQNNDEEEKKMVKVEETEVIKKFNIHFTIISPLFVCPLGKADAWCLNLGNLAVFSERKSDREIFPMRITSAYFRYYENSEDIFTEIYQKKSGKSSAFSVINNINFEISHTNFFIQKTSTTEVELPNFQVNFTESQYQNLLTLGQIFKTEESAADFLEILKKNRKQVEDKMRYCGMVMKKNQDLDTWKTFYGILSDEFIYLYGSQKQLKCIEKISIKQSRLQFDEETAVISLFDRQGIVELTGTDHDRNTQNWRKEIEAQIKEFMSIYEIVDMAEHQQSMKASRKRKQTAISESAIKNNAKQLKVRINKISFNYRNNTGQQLINFHVINLRFSEERQKTLAKRSIQIEEFYITDYLHKYKSKALQTLLKASLISINIQRLKKDTQKKIQIEANLPKIYINWKPDVLIILLQLAYKHFSKEKKLRMDDGTEKTRQQIFKQVFSDKKFQILRQEYERNSKERKVKEKRNQYAQKNSRTKQLICLNCRMEEVEIVMIHRQSHIPMFKLIAQKMNNELVIGEDEKFVAGSVNSCYLYDLTEYPKNEYSEGEHLKQFELLRPKQKIGNEDMITYKWSSYEAFKIPNSERVNSFMLIEINPMICEYFQQITFRLIDYILIQIILLLNEPDMLVANENLLQQLKKSSNSENMREDQLKSSSQSFGQHSPIVKILFSEYEEVIRKIVNPYFMDMHFVLKNPSIFIRPEKQSDVYHRVDFNQIVFTNRNIKSSRRFEQAECPQARQYIYEEQYVIDCRCCDFYTIQENKEDLIELPFQEQKLFESIDISLLVNKLIQEDEINVIYPEINTYDRSFYTHGFIQKLGINKCTKQQYLFLNKLVNFNMIFDDNKDQLFIHNFKITKLLSPKPIFFELKIPMIYLFAKEGTEQNNYDLFDVQMRDFRLIFQRNKDLNSNYSIKVNSAYIYGYEYSFDGKFDDKEMIKKSLSRHEKSQKNIPKSKPKKQQLMQIKGQNQQQCLETVIKMKNTGEKLIQMNILNIQMSFKAHLLQLILQWSLLEDWVFPTVSIYANDITFHLTIHKMSAWLIEAFKNHKKEHALYGPQSFQLLGVFCYKFHRKANFSQQHLQDLYRKKQITANEINGMPDYSYMSVIMNTEIFHCKPEEKVNKKRQVAQKMTFNMIQKRYYKVASQEYFTIKAVGNRQLNIDRSLLKISFTDVMLMEQILKDLSEDVKYIGHLKAALIKSGKNLEERSPMKSELSETEIKRMKEIQNKETEISSLQNLQIEIQSLAIYLINNSRSCFTPIMKININSASFNKCATSKKDILKGSFVTTAYYFNGSIFRWEPMLEKCEILFQKLIYKNQDLPDTTFSSLESPDNIVFNISKEYVLALKDVLNQWNKKKKTTKIQKPNEKIEVYRPGSSSLIQLHSEKHIQQSREMVSQYTIRNESGYPIEIYSHNPNIFLQKINHGEEMDYEYELQKYESSQNSEISMLFAINILHHDKKFKKITHIPLDFNKQFHVFPVIQDSSIEGTKKKLPRNSYLRFLNEIKDLKKYCIIKSSKEIEDYTPNMIKRLILRFDSDEEITLKQEPHRDVRVHLFKKLESKKYRYFGQHGLLKITPHSLVYNYTPIPLNVNGNEVMPGQFVGVFDTPVINNVRYDECRVIKIDRKENTREYIIYCEGYIIDYAGLYYELGNSYDYKTFSHDFIHNTYKFRIYLLPSAQNKIKLRLNKKFKSTDTMKCSATIKCAVGNEPFYLESPSGAFCEYQSYGYLSNFTGNQYTDFKKIIEVTPYYVLQNSTNMKIKVCQAQSCESMNLQKNQRVPFYWENKKKPLQIKIAAFTETEMWGYSGPMQIKQNVHSFVLRNSVKLFEYKIFSITLENTNTITIVHINEINEEKGGVLMLCNEVPGISLKFYQAGIFEKDHEIMDPQQYIFTVNEGESIPFGYELPLEKHELVMETVLDESQKKYEGAYLKQYIFDNIETNLFERQLSVYRQGKRIKKLLIVLAYEGNVKKLKLLQGLQPKVQENLSEFLCKLPRVAINLIGYQDNIRKQIAAMYLDGIQYQKAQTNLTTTQTIVIKSFKIDNCLKYDPIFPVLFTSTTTKASEEFIRFVIIKDKFNSNLIHYLGILTSKFIISITSDEIKCLQENIAEIQSSWSDEKNQKSLKFREYEMFKQQYNDTLLNDIYFVDAIINPIKANFTFKHVNDWGGRVLRAFASIDNCNISVDGKRIMHFSSRNVGEFLKHVLKHYQEGIKSQFIPMLGNLSIIGSPISLATRIGSGFKDFIQLPSEGFNVGLMEGGKGLAKGTGSLFKNTFEGAFNSVQSITGSVGNGISSLVYDQDYNNSRNKIKNQRSEHVGEGLMSGGKSIINGIGRGLTGLVTQPVKGAQESGIGGFFVGGLKGLTGLVTKPVSGIIDAATKTAQGIKNTPSYFDKKDKGLTNGRIRNPRAFYGYNREIRQFDEDISLCAKMLTVQDSEKYQNLSWYNIYHLVSNKENEKKPLLLLTFEYMVIYNIKSGEIIKSYGCRYIFKAERRDNFNVLVSVYDKKKKGIGKLELHLKQPIGEKLMNEINTICRFYRPVYGYDYKPYIPEFTL